MLIKRFFAEDKTPGLRLGCFVSVTGNLILKSANSL